MSSTYYDAAMAIKPDLVKFMQDIIRIPSLKFRGRCCELSAFATRCCVSATTKSRLIPMGNVIGRIGSGPRVIAFDGHVDTVDVGDPSSSGIAIRIRAISRATFSTDAAPAT